MALQLVLDANGNYTYQDVAPQKTTPVINNEFEARIQYGKIELWNVSNITNMSGLFLNKSTFNDAILNLRASGFGYGGGVKFPESMQRIGTPDKIEYFDRGIDNLGIGFQKGLENGLFSLDGNYNPQTNDKSINAKLKLNF